MKKTGIINSEVSAVVANMGHMDWLSIGRCRHAGANGNQEDRSGARQAAAKLYGRLEQRLKGNEGSKDLPCR